MPIPHATRFLTPSSQRGFLCTSWGLPYPWRGYGFLDVGLWKCWGGFSDMGWAGVNLVPKELSLGIPSAGYQDWLGKVLLESSFHRPPSCPTAFLSKEAGRVILDHSAPCRAPSGSELEGLVLWAVVAQRGWGQGGGSRKCRPDGEEMWLLWLPGWFLD